MKKPILALVIAVAWSPAWGQTFSGFGAADLLHHCATYERTNWGTGEFFGNRKEQMEATFCLAWVNGVFNALAAGLCWPDDTDPTNDQMIQVFLTYLEGNPERHDEQAFALARDAFEKAFPCKPKDHGPATAPGTTRR